MGKPPTTLRDIANALGTSIGSVHRALHDNPGVSPMTKARVLQLARTMGYRPNLAARYLSSKKTWRISVNTLKGTTSFWDEVRAGIREEAASILLENVEIEFRTHRRLGEGEEEAFESAIRDQVNGIITFPSRPQILRPWIRRASRAQIPVVCVATDAPHSGRLGIVAVDTLASGSIAADLMGRFLRGQEGAVAITLFDRAITEHAEKYAAFENTLQSFYPNLQLLKPLEDHGVESEAYSKCRKLFDKCPNLSGVYVTTEASIPVLNAARDANVLRASDHYYDRPVSRSCSSHSISGGGGDHLPASPCSGPDGISHAARVPGGGRKSIASGRAGAAPGDARESGFLSAQTVSAIGQGKNRATARNGARPGRRRRLSPGLWDRSRL